MGLNKQIERKDESNIKLINGNFLNEVQDIENGSIDLILTDPPYGTINGADLDGWEDKDTQWDNSINPKKFINIMNKLLRKNGKGIFFGQEPYTSMLITSQSHRVNFCYRLIWEKEHFANGLFSKNAPVKYTEDIVVFSKNYDTHRNNPLRDYFKDVLEFMDVETKSEIHTKLGHYKTSHCFRIDGEQFSTPTRKAYMDLIKNYNINEMDGFLKYSEMKEKEYNYNKETQSIFNLPDGENHKSDILKYKKPSNNDHPTQKPVGLLRDLIRTYTKEGDTVLDLTMGSGSTGVACAKENRDFIGIELDEEYYNIAKERIL